MGRQILHLTCRRVTCSHNGVFKLTGLSRPRTIRCSSSNPNNHSVLNIRRLRSIRSNTQLYDPILGISVPEKYGPVKKTPEIPVPRQFSIICSDPKLTKKQEIIDAAKKSRVLKALWSQQWAGPEQALVILTTPSFAAWLEDDYNFVPKILEALTFRDALRRNSIIVISAVVDGLSPSSDEVPLAERLGTQEGFSFLFGRRGDILGSNKDVWNPESIKEDTTNPGKLSSLILSGKDTHTNFSMTLPLANTLFVNGKHSTLIATQWNRGQNSDVFWKVKTEHKQYQRIYAFRRGNTVIPPMFIPAIPLTPARPITSGLGNIVRQIAFGTGDTGARPASQELETQVTNYMKFSKTDTNIGVWAVIFRKELVGVSFGSKTTYIEQSVDSSWEKEREHSRFVGTQIARGAILCRVLSGGGGWGAKQGLLSLDPETNYEYINEARFDWSTGSIKEQQDSALGELARQGDLIQFFAVNPNKVKNVKFIEESKSIDLHYWKDSISAERPREKRDRHDAARWIKNTVFGVVPSTIDDLPGENRLQLLGGGITFREGHFGAVSESGIYLRSEQLKRKPRANLPDEFEHIDTKIDIPHSYVYRKFAQEKSLLNDNIRFDWSGLGQSLLRAKMEKEELTEKVKKKFSRKEFSKKEFSKKGFSKRDFSKKEFSKK